MSPHSSACVLCGNDVATEVRMALVEWREPVTERWSAIPRCLDRAACRIRVEAIPEPWPIADGTPPSVLLPVAEPEAEHLPAHVEEEIVPWLK